MKIHSNQFSSKYSQSGFNIIEVMIVVVIISIVGSLAVPSYQTFIRNLALTGTANEITATLQTARTEAIKRSQNVTVCFKQNDNGTLCRTRDSSKVNVNYIYVFLDVNNNLVLDPGEVTLFTSNQFNEQVKFNLPEAVRPIFGSTDTQSIVYNSRGQAIIDQNPANRSTVIGLCDDRKTNDVGRYVSIGNTGRASTGRLIDSKGLDIAC